MRRVNLMISGLVQGVGFRFYTLTVANQLGITGWVANRYDGSVEILAEGSPEKITQFLTYVEEGPRFSSVDAIVVTDLEGSSEYHSFSIK